MSSAVPKRNKADDLPITKNLPLEERIRHRALEIYQQRGGQDGSELDDWLQAEAEILDAEGEQS